MICEYISQALRVLERLTADWEAVAALNLPIPVEFINDILEFAGIINLRERARQIIYIVRFVQDRQFAPEIELVLTTKVFTEWSRQVRYNRLAPSVDPQFLHHENIPINPNSAARLRPIGTLITYTGISIEPSLRTPHPSFSATLNLNNWSEELDNSDPDAGSLDSSDT